MKYKDYRDQIKTGDVLVWSHRSWKTWYDIKVQAIRVFTSSEYVHVGIAWVYAGRVFVIESVNPYVRIVPLSNLLPCYVFNMSRGLTVEAINTAFDMVGKAKYSQLEAVKAYFSNNKTLEAWQCVEFVKYILGKSGLSIISKDTPSDFVLSLQKLGYAMYYIE